MNTLATGETRSRDDALLSPELDVMWITAPRVHSALLGAWRAASVAIDPKLFSSTLQRVEARLGLVDRVVGEPDTPLLGAAGELIEQFVFYVPDVTESLLAPLRAHLGQAGLETFVQVLYLIDQTTRLRLIYRQLFGVTDMPVTGRANPDATWGLREALAQVHATTMCLSDLDELTSEIVRLRAASYHHCKLCMSVRLAGASGSVVNEDLAEQIAHCESSSFAEAHKVALRYADTHMTDPRNIGAVLREQLVKYYTRSQIIELTLDVSQWNQQKILVALGTDAAVSESGLTPLMFDADGHIIHGAAGSAS